MRDEFIGLRVLYEVLAHRALLVCEGKDGRSLFDADRVRLRELSEIAAACCLPEADRFFKLANVADRGETRDLERACLTILAGVG